jgi:hypothetical protein
MSDRAVADHETDLRPPALPGWVKVFVIVFVLLALVFVGLHLTGHSPMQHLPLAGANHSVQLP